MPPAVPVLIPAYRPGGELPRLVASLLDAGLPAVLIVDDGSGPAYEPMFQQCVRLAGARLLRHRRNLGKGAALKTGIGYLLEAFPGAAGMVTADADGQHLPADILRVAQALVERPGSLVLGARSFGAGVPLRSRFGNSVTRLAVRLFLGPSLSDTQTGLRGIPRSLMTRLPGVAANGYEFELDMLAAAKHHGCPITEVPIQTVYLEANVSSHFNPLRDSMKIYFVLLRFTSLSLLTALVDNLVFFAAYGWLGAVATAQVTGRSAAVLFNYAAARRAVFLSDERHRVLLPRYLLLVAGSGLASYGLIRLLVWVLPVSVILAKMAAETLLFVLNFLIQRDLVFTRRRAPAGATDWDRYYRSTPLTARLTRRYTASVLIAALRDHAGLGNGGGKTLVELGGANSCFLNRILAELRPAAYHVVDTNPGGLALLESRLAEEDNVRLHCQDVLDLSLEVSADAVFSVGLVEHFDPAGTRKALLAHFRLLRRGGCAVVSFPTPTPLYRAARFLAERLGLWHFPDERPLSVSEVLDTVGGLGEVVFQKTLWPLVFTQHMMVIRKLGAG